MTQATADRLAELRADWKAARKRMWDLNDDGDTTQSQIYARKAENIVLEIEKLEATS